jgi:N-sulfoglucosamine sulfohydrolase
MGNREKQPKMKHYPFLKTACCAVAPVLFLVLSCGRQGDSAAGLRGSRPNILIAISDDQSFPHCGAYGSKWLHTPAFDKIARQGILFMTCMAPSPGCAPSRSALMTGRYPWQNEQAGQHQSEYPLKYVTFPDLLEKSGYHIGYTGKGCDPFNWKISGRTRNPVGPAYNDVRYADDARDGPPAGGISMNNYAENFKVFYGEKEPDQPFFFWYGASEPHRAYEHRSGIRLGKKPAHAAVPGFLPDADTIREDLLDYALEIEWFDLHLQRILDYLEQAGELENTLVIVTSDNGMPFPSAKANAYEYGIHLPLAMAWPANMVPGRMVEDPVSFVDFAPTILELAGGDLEKGMLPMSGKSLLNILASGKQEVVDVNRSAVFSSRERHSSSRWNNLGYPQRAIRTREYLYILNLKPERWPAGAPVRLDENGHPEPGVAYHDIDGSPTLEYLFDHRMDEEVRPFFEHATAKRPPVELYDIIKDPNCLVNLAGEGPYQDIRKDLHGQLTAFLVKTEDPRMVGEDPDIFETYKRYANIRNFPEPEWAKQKEGK